MTVLKSFYIMLSALVVATIGAMLLNLVNTGIFLWLTLAAVVLSSCLVIFLSTFVNLKPERSEPIIYRPPTYEMKQRIWVLSKRLQIGYTVACKYYGVTAFPDSHCIIMEIRPEEIVVKGLTTRQVYTMPYYALTR